MISESKLRKQIKEAVHNVLNEVSYDTARRAYEKALQTGVDKRFNPIPGKYERAERLYNHLKDKAPQNVNNSLPVIIVGGPNEGMYEVGDLEKDFEVTGHVEPSQNPRYNNSPLVGLPRLKGLIGPMLDGNRIRYESQEAYDFFSR